MKHQIQDYELELIDEPLQSHVVAWEKASRALKTEDAKPLLEEAQSSFGTIDTKNVNLAAMLIHFVKASKLLAQAMQIIENNETLTVTANHGVMVKAAFQVGWIVSFTKAGAPIEDVETFKPWLTTWAATHIAQLYMEATSIPKN